MCIRAKGFAPRTNFDNTKQVGRKIGTRKFDLLWTIKCDNVSSIFKTGSSLSLALFINESSGCDTRMTMADAGTKRLTGQLECYFATSAFLSVLGAFDMLILMVERLERSIPVRRKIENGEKRSQIPVVAEAHPPSNQPVR
jgi:hypothetical protein